MKILILGEIVGKAGIFVVKNMLRKMIDEREIDFVIANGEGATGGFGLGMNHSIYLRKMGVDVITLGEKSFFKKDMVGHMQKAPYILRPANLPYETPGKGWRYYQIRRGGDPDKTPRIGVITLLGQSGFHRMHVSNPFTMLPSLIEKVKKDCRVVIVDFHAATTAEKYTMFHYADGKVTAVAGTHTKALTSDAQILPRGTAVIADTGRVGSIQSVGGFEPSVEIDKFLTGIPERSNDAWEGLEIQGALVEADPETGKALSIETIRLACTAEPQE